MQPQEVNKQLTCYLTVLVPCGQQHSLMPSGHLQLIMVLQLKVLQLPYCQVMQPLKKQKGMEQTHSLIAGASSTA